jgi:hypothetical protein
MPVLTCRRICKSDIKYFSLEKIMCKEEDGVTGCSVRERRNKLSDDVVPANFGTCN